MSRQRNENDESDIGCYGYRLDRDGNVESRTFETGRLPAGWQDTPAKLPWYVNHRLFKGATIG
jgi:hypothetical protein